MTESQMRNLIHTVACSADDSLFAQLVKAGVPADRARFQSNQIREVMRDQLTPRLLPMCSDSKVS